MKCSTLSKSFFNALPKLFACGETKLDTIEVTILPKPNAGFLLSDSILCLDIAGKATIYVEDTTMDTDCRVWHFGYDNIDTQQITNYSFTQKGNHSIDLVVCKGSCNDTAYKKVLVNSCYLGVGYMEEIPFSIYPNPCQGTLIIEKININKRTKLSLYNNLGQLIRSENFNEDKILLKGIPQGFFLVNITSEGTLLYQESIFSY